MYRRSTAFFILSTCLCTTLALSLRAQDTTALASRWEIGINVLPVISREASTNSSILIRRQLNARAALRTRLGAEFSFREQNIPIDDHFFIRPGFELTRYFSSRASLHYGVDVGYERERMTLYIIDARQWDRTSVQEHTSYKRTLGTGLFVGYRYMFLKNLSFYLETGFNYENPKYKVNILNGLIAVDGQITPGTVMITGFRYSKSHYFFLKPLQTLNISFHF